MAAPTTPQPTPQLSALPPLPSEYWASGGEARLWIDPSDPRFLIKVFYDEMGNQPRPRTGAAAQHLVDLTSRSCSLLPSEWFELVEHFAWPVALFGPSLDHIDAIRIPLAGGEYFVDIESIYGHEQKPLGLEYLITNYLEKPVVVSSTAPTVTPGDRAEVALSCARALQLIWQQGLLYGDLSAKNVLWTTHPRPRAFFLDVESCRPQGDVGVFSPDWKPLEHLDGRVEGERSLLARLVWRLFEHSRNDAMPAVGIDEGDLAALGPAAKTALLDCHQTGSAESFNHLLDELRRLRTAKHESQFFDWAVMSGFARIVIESAPARPNAAQRDSLEAAERQAALEHRLSARRAANLTATSEPGFNLDLPNSQTPISRINGPDDLRHLYETGEFQVVAEMFAAGNAQVAVDSKFTRVIRHALAEVGSPTVLSSTVAGTSTIKVSWSWPAAQWVNHCTLRQIDSNGNELASIDCPRDGRPPMASVGPWPTNGGSLVITFAVGDGRGTVVEGDARTGSVTAIAVPPRRVNPVAPTSPATRPTITLPVAPIERSNFLLTATHESSSSPTAEADPAPTSTPITSTTKKGFWRRLFRRRK